MCFMSNKQFSTMNPKRWVIYKFANFAILSTNSESSFFWKFLLINALVQWYNSIEIHLLIIIIYFVLIGSVIENWNCRSCPARSRRTFAFFQAKTITSPIIYMPRYLTSNKKAIFAIQCICVLFWRIGSCLFISLSL